MAIAQMLEENMGPPVEDPGDADDAVVARARVDRRAFAPLYERYAERVFRFCWRRLESADAASDATAHVFTRALAGLDGYRGGGELSFRAWLFAIAHHTVADAHRRRIDDPLDAAAEVVDGVAAHAPELASLALERRSELRRALAQLPDDQRRIVELRLAGLNGVEIAAALGKTHSSIKSGQFRAYAKLRALLRPEEESDAPR